MGALTSSCPKPLLAVAGRPIIVHILCGLAQAGVSEFVVVTGHLGEQIEAALGDGRQFGVGITYRRQAQAQGTARALLLVREVLRAGPFVLSWGDILVQPGFYGALLARFRRHPCEALLALNPVDDPWQGAAVYTAPAGRVTRITEKPPRGSSTTKWNNAGVFVFDPVILDYAARLRPSGRGEYELPQAIAAMVDDGRQVFGLAIAGYWSDVGTPADLQRAEVEFARVTRRTAEPPAGLP
ncbi:MAG: nucleotidyltransferase family protein [Deltaproteobacteria bacterium]|nr:nucleotidyltransferase family protein [Deltaproteobacteria bacterium]